jgi:hypothetical protein
MALARRAKESSDSRSISGAAEKLPPTSAGGICDQQAGKLGGKGEERAVDAGDLTGPEGGPLFRYPVEPPSLDGSIIAALQVIAGHHWEVHAAVATGDGTAPWSRHRRSSAAAHDLEHPRHHLIEREAGIDFVAGASSQQWLDGLL